MTIAAGTHLGRYEIRSKIGEGGMGEVYLAQDMELGRTVAIKILPPALASDQQRLQRFIQEAKAASALNHPHILTIYEIGVTGNSRFIATEFIDGDTLRPHIGAGMKLAEVLEIAIQACSALQAAHAAGIIHRDIKPENIMVRRDGYIKVLDFGLAKLTEPKGSPTDTEAPTRAMVNTGAGTVMGTANYMSPEQAKGTHVDERSDLWSLGALLYEMVTGHLPFAGETPTETISLILQKEPAPLVRYAHEVPDELERIVTKALTKDREERYQTARDMLIDLRHLKRKLEVDAEIDRTVPPELRAAVSTGGVPGGSSTASGAVAATSVAGTPHGPSSAEYIVTEIRRHKKGAALIAALFIVGLAVAAFVYFSRKTPALTAKDTVLLADFVNTTGEPVFDGTLKQALAVQLGQSPFLNIFPDERVNETLRFMGRSANERITKDVAKEICERQGLKAMIVGSIASLGSHYVVTLEAINAHAGDAIAREQSEAENKEQVLKALGKAASQLREKLGESLSSIKKFDAPIEQATTSSLEALKAFSQGNELVTVGNQLDAIPFYKRAIELDPNFALAYARLAVIYSNRFQTELAAQYSQKAYDLRDRASERERFYISEKYTSFVTGNREEANSVLKAWAQNYPNDSIPHNNLAVNYTLVGQYEDALKESREAVRLSPNSATSLGNYAEGFMRLNRFDEARQVLEQTLGQNPDRHIYHSYSFQLAFLRGDQDTMKRDLDWWAKRPTKKFFDYQAGAAAFYGQWHKALDFNHRSIELMLSQDRKENAGQSETNNSFIEAVLGRCQQAKESVTRGVLLSRDRIGLASGAVTLAYCNEPGQAQPLLDELQKRFPKDTATNGVLIPMIRAAMEMNRGNTTQAIELLRPASRFELGAVAGFGMTYLRGEIYLRQKSGKEAAAEFQKILDHRGIESLSPLYPLAHLGLARASVLSGDTAKARKEYQDFLALWKDADADLPVLQQAKDEYEKLK